MRVELVVPFERASGEMRRRAALSLSLPCSDVCAVRDGDGRITEILVPFNRAESWMLWKCERIVRNHHGDIVERIGATPESWENSKGFLSQSRRRLFNDWSANGISWMPAESVATIVIGRGGSHPIRTERQSATTQEVKA